MSINLVQASMDDAELIWKMQLDSFSELYEKYKDTSTNPAAEPIGKVIERLRQPHTYYYLIKSDDEIAGAIRVVDFKIGGKPKRISPIFVLKDFRNKGIAQAAMLEAERIHGSDNWELETIISEPGNCHLYEKMGYQRLEKTLKINDRLTLVYYKK